MFAVMLFHHTPKEVIPFYAIPEGTGRTRKKFYSETKGVRSIETIHILDIDQPESAMLQTLRIIAENDGKIRKKALVQKICEQKLLDGFKANDKGQIMKDDLGSPKPDKRELRNAQSNAFHVAENRIFRDLKGRWKAVKEENKARNRHLELTENGEFMATIFFGIGKAIESD